MKHKSKMLMCLTVLLVLFIIPSLCFATSEYFQEDYWEWHTRTTTSDMAYNGKHIQFGNNKIDFYGYGDISYKDYLFKEYNKPGEKTFRFILDESKANYHTLDGAGFIFNAKEENGKLTGDVLAINQTQITIYRIENIDIDTFETSPARILSNYATKVLVTANKPSTTIHQFEIKTSPTKVIVNDNGTNVINLDLDYSTHAGEGFGLLVSYNQHACSILTQIEFSEFELEVKDYIIPILKTDKEGNPLKGAEFEILDSNNNVIETGVTDKDGKMEVKGYMPGTYKVREKTAPIGYVLNTNAIEFIYTNDGRILNSSSRRGDFFTLF